MIVRRIYAEYISGMTLQAVADGLTRDRIPTPAARDPVRNKRPGTAWTKDAVREILANPRYTGRQVRNRHRTGEVLADPRDVSLGYSQKMRPDQPGAWVWPAPRDR